MLLQIFNQNLNGVSYYNLSEENIAMLPFEKAETAATPWGLRSLLAC